jgi:predicted ribosome quality control (RQC) complex YloA/Tae2 family protein
MNTQALGGDDRLHLRDGALELTLAVNDQVVIPGKLAQLLTRLLDPLLEGLLGFGPPAPQALDELIEAGRPQVDENGIRRLLLHLRRTLDVDLEQNGLSGRQRAADVFDRRSIGNPVDLGPFQEPSGCTPLGELLGREEVVALARNLSRTDRPTGGSHDAREGKAFLLQPGDYRIFAGAARTREDNQQTGPRGQKLAVGPGRRDISRARRVLHGEGITRPGHRVPVRGILVPDMTYDGLTMTALAVELRSALDGARVQKIVQPDPLSIALELYGNHRRQWLLLSADPRYPRVYLAADRPGRGVETPTPLLLLLRKHIDGRRLTAIEQPPGERILIFSFASPAVPDDTPNDGPSRESAPRAPFRLIIEAIGQYSNLILVDAEGIVREAARRVTADQNRYRVTLPHHPYVPPPAQSKRQTEVASPEDCQLILAAVPPGSAVWQALVGGFAGLGPLAAREITFRALGDARARVPAEASEQARVAERLAAALREIVDPILADQFQASVALDGETIVAFAPYPLTHLGTWQPRPSLSAAAEEFYRQEQGVRAVDLARRALQATLERERSLAERKRESLQRALAGASQADDYRQRGDLLLAYASTIPRGATQVTLDGVTIELDPRLGAVENARAYYRRYQKTKAALQEVPALLQETELRLRYLDELAALAEIAETVEAVRALQQEVRPASEGERPSGRRRHPRQPPGGVLRLQLADGTEVLVGRTARQNHEVTFELARPDDIWLHARGCPGAHVVLRSNSKEVSPRLIREAAAIAAYYSANRASDRVTVDWTRRKFVRRLGTGTPGLVSYSGEQSVVVRPRDPLAASGPAEDSIRQAG